MVCTTTSRQPLRAAGLVRRCLLAALPLLLAACGGGTDEDCTAAGQKASLARYMDDWYFWYRLAPRPDPDAYAGVADFFRALLYAGGDPAFPADRWSRSESDASFYRYYEQAATLGWGVAVNAIEVAGIPAAALRVRHVEPGSDAANKGVVRGDQVVAVNGRAAADLIAANDFSVFEASARGERLTLVLRRAGIDRTVVLEAGVFPLATVSGAAVTTTAGGRKLAYLMVKDLLWQAEGPIDDAFANFRAQGAQDLVLDMRYTGAGFVAMGRLLASYVAGAGAGGRTYAALRFNDKRAAHSDVTYVFRTPRQALDLQRVFVLTGPRTCAAAEQVINGLRGVGVAAVAIGSATCGKPLGSQAASLCGTTYSVVNFEVVNAQGSGRYFNGLAPQCALAEDLATAPGAPDDPLMAAARSYADSGACPAGTGQVAGTPPPSARALFVEPGVRGALLER